MNGGDRAGVRRAAAARWFVLLGGMSAFAANLLIGFYLVPAACLLGTRAPLYGTSAVFGTIAAIAVGIGWRRRRAPGPPGRRDWPPGRGSSAERARFMVGAGLLLSALGLLIVLFTAATLPAFDPCLNPSL